MPSVIQRTRLPVNPNPQMGVACQISGTQFLSLADNADMSGGNFDFTFAGWVRFDLAPGTNTHIFGKYAGAAGTREYVCFRLNTGIIRFNASADGSGATVVDASTFGATQQNVWYFVVVQYNGANIRISVNNGAFNQTAFTGALFDSPQRFTFGSTDASGVSGMRGILDNWYFWKSTPGGGGAIGDDAVACLWNGGQGLTFREFPSGLHTALTAAWPMDGDLMDKTGRGNDLTNNGSAATTQGKR
jgi:hypothetical protein